MVADSYRPALGQPQSEHSSHTLAPVDAVGPDGATADYEPSEHVRTAADVIDMSAWQCFRGMVYSCNGLTLLAVGWLSGKGRSMPGPHDPRGNNGRSDHVSEFN